MKSSEFFAVHEVFSLEDAVGSGLSTGGRAGALETLRYHLEAGRLKGVSRGIYAVVPPGIKPDRFHPDPFLVASTIRPEGVFSHHAALDLLGAAHVVWNEVTMYAHAQHRQLRLPKAVRFLTHPVAVVRTGDLHLGTRQVEHLGRLLRTTGPERTLVESLRRPWLVGGLENLVASASGLSLLDLDLLESILKVYDMGTLWGGVGWFLEQHQEEFGVPDGYLQRLEGKRPSAPRYLLRNSRGGSLLPRWNLILPPGVESWEEVGIG